MRRIQKKKIEYIKNINNKLITNKKLINNEQFTNSKTIKTVNHLNISKNLYKFTKSKLFKFYYKNYNRSNIVKQYGNIQIKYILNKNIIKFIPNKNYIKRIDKKLKIYVYVVCYNEQYILPYFLEHYKYADKIFVYDNCSTDNSINLINSNLKCELFLFKSKFDDSINQYIKNNCWKQHKGMCDYAIVCDMDEFLWFPINIYNYLNEQKQNKVIFDFFKIKGFNMASHKKTKCKNLAKFINTGYYCKFYSKNIIFNPNTIIDINYSPGCHYSRPIKNSNIILGPTLYLLHYKYIGGIDRLIKRKESYSKRLSKKNITNKWGLHYLKKNNEIKNEYNLAVIKSKEIFKLFTSF